MNGKWRLLYTSSDGTASPIQRGFVGSSAVTVYQNIDLDSAPGVEPTVTNLVDFGKYVPCIDRSVCIRTDTGPPTLTPSQYTTGSAT